MSLVALVAAGVCDEALVQVAYAIGVAEPVGLYVNTYGTSKVGVSDGEIAERIKGIFPMRPYDIEQRFALRTRSSRGRDQPLPAAHAQTRRTEAPSGIINAN